MTKKCAKCGQEKELTEFYKRSKGESGVASYCKPCNRQNHADNAIKRNQKVKDAERAKFDKLLKEAS